MTDEQANRAMLRGILEAGGVDLLATMISERYSVHDRELLVEQLIDHGLQESPGDEKWLELKRKQQVRRAT